jgi:hypothetical protein
LEPAGTVLDQVPSAGRVVNGPVTLVVAEALPAMLDWVGQPLASARQWLEDRGVEIRIETRLDAEVPPNTVMDQIPAPGAEVGPEVVLGVSTTPVILPLVELGTTSQEFLETIASMGMNGDAYLNTVYFGLERRDCCRRLLTGFAEYNLSRDWVTLEMTLGISDVDDASSTSLVEFFLDGTKVEEQTVAFGSTVDVAIDVTDVLRLRIVATEQTGNGDVGMGNARLIGAGAPDDRE